MPPGITMSVKMSAISGRAASWAMAAAPLSASMIW